MELFWWLFAVFLFAVGLIGTVLPIFPGTTIILAAAVIHRMMLGPEKSIGWKSISLLVLLTLVSFAFDFLGSCFGAKYFGATRWAAFGAVVGAVVEEHPALNVGVPLHRVLAGAIRAVPEERANPSARARARRQKDLKEATATPKQATTNARTNATTKDLCASRAMVR